MTMTCLFWLIIGHFIADYPLQTDFIAKFKSRKNSLEEVPWYLVMSGHAAVHAAAVALATGVWWIGALEFVCHWIIDTFKCEGYLNIHEDQELHIAFKLPWWVLAGYYGV